MAPQGRCSVQPWSTFRSPVVVVVFLTVVCSQVAQGFMTREMIKQMVSASQPPLQPHVLGTPSAECAVKFAAGLQNIYVLDAMGKPQSGILQGNLAWIGHYDECQNITNYNYCLLQLSLENISFSVPVELSWGVCVPEVCSESDVLDLTVDLLDLIENPFNISAVNASAVGCARTPPAPYNTGFIATTIIITIIVILMMLGTFLETTLRSVDYKPPVQSGPLVVNARGTRDPVPYPSEGEHGGEQRVIEEDSGQIQTEEQEEKPTACTRAWQEFLLCFAVNCNLKKLMSTKTAKGSIGCLNGIRVISMSWVILGHVVLIMPGTGLVGNMLFALSVLGRFGFQAVSNAESSVDTFFFLSGLLVTYMTLGRMVKTGGRIPWHWYIFHRYWRLTPVLGITILLYLFIRPHMGNGPTWHFFIEDPYCAKYWWYNLLYINNFNMLTTNGACFSWVWYLANDMQFFVLSPFILILLHRVPKLGLLSLATIAVVSVVTTAILMVKYQFVPDPFLAGKGNDPNHTYENEIYVKPWCRVSPYLVGMAMGYFLHRYRERSFKLHPTIVAAGWAIATAIAMSVVYGLYGNYHGNPFTVAQFAAYTSLSKIAWASSLCWVVFACHYGYGGWINDFLSWDVWLPMGRLTYSAYLLHPLVLFNYFYGLKNAYFYSLYTMPFEFAGLFTLSFAASVVMALFVEYPVANMEKIIMPGTFRKKN